jgi:hypothetical protein
MKKKYMVNTGNGGSWHNTLDEAIVNFTNWCIFYNKNKGYGNRIIELTKNTELICNYEIFE